MTIQIEALRTPALRLPRGRSLMKQERVLVNGMCFSHTPTQMILESLEHLQQDAAAHHNGPGVRLLSEKTISHIKSMFNRLDRLEAEFEEAGEAATQAQADAAVVAQAARDILLSGGSLSGSAFNALFIP